MKKKKRIQLKPGDYEGYQYGPLKLERIGRVVRMTNSSSSAEHKELIEYVTAQRPILERQINEKIQRLLTIVKQYDCLQLLPVVSFHNIFGDPEEYRETTHEGKESYIEYAFSLATSVGNPHDESPKKDVIDEFEKLIKEVFREAQWFFTTENLAAKVSQKDLDIKSKSLLAYLFMRGASFPEHHIELIKDLFEDKKIVNFFQTNYGFIPTDLIKTHENIEKQIKLCFDSFTSFALKTKELHKDFIVFCETEAAKNAKNEKELSELFRNSTGIKDRIQEGQKFLDIAGSNHFEITPQNDIEKIIFPLISIEMGANTEFIQPPHGDAWPTSPSAIYSKPILRANDAYYCFVPNILFRQMTEILEGLIRASDVNFYKTYYTEKRAKLLESKTVEYFRKLLPGANIYQNLFYFPKNDGLNPTETDAIILYDNNIFLIECKSGKFTTPAQRGAIERIKTDSKKLVDQAYNQAKTTKKYIEETDIPQFFNSNGKLILQLSNKLFFENYFYINTTLDSLNHLTTQLNSLKNLGLIQGEEWPWSVFINDLRTISEILETPTEFLLFLQRRIRANDFTQFKSFDELDFLMFFLTEGLFFEDGILGNLNGMSPWGYTENLDRYYDHLAGRVSTGDKPRMKISDDYRTLLKKIEAINKPYRTKLTTYLLGLSAEAQKGIFDTLQTLIHNALKTHTTKDASLFFSDYGITFVVPQLDSEEFRSKMETFCRVKKYSAKFTEWFVVILSGNSLEDCSIDFEIYKFPWQRDKTMEHNFDIYKKTKWLRMKESHEKIGRNDSCFCGSGKKYKKCCLLEGFF